MNCENFEAKVSVYIDGELDDQEAETLFRHLGVCTSCRKAMTEVLELRSGFQEQAPVLAPKELDERILRITRARESEYHDRRAIPAMLWRRRISIRVPVVAVAASLILFVSFLASSIWLAAKQQGENAKVQTVFLTAVPVVEVRAYAMEPVTTIQ
jgi:anti-sigma factor RsiW